MPFSTLVLKSDVYFEKLKILYYRLGLIDLNELEKP